MSFLAIVAAAFEAGAQAPAEAHAAGLPQFDPTSWPSQIFWLAIFFGGLYWLMAGYFLPRIGATIEERRDRIADDLDQATEFREEAAAAERAYEQALADATAKARAIAAETRANLTAEIAEMSAEADKKAAEAIAAAEARIADMKADAAAAVREAAVETARAIVAALIDETPTAESVAAAMPERVNA
ncbi:MAG: ATP F0F1 synthase subunit B [Alphaproteobacteria bacterium]|nr:ATP F0F1 synthase subunit B [Alphaproteobacteria bacterium]